MNIFKQLQELGKRQKQQQEADRQMEELSLAISPENRAAWSEWGGALTDDERDAMIKALFSGNAPLFPPVVEGSVVSQEIVEGR